MNVENTKTLIEKYPKIFRQHTLSPKETAMCWLFECNDGWYWLIDNLCSQLQWDIDRNGEPQIEAIQVKEKFGTLRFYVNSATDKQYAMIEFAEFLSGSMCELCGEINATITNGGWIKTLCNECKEKCNV